MNQSSSLCSFVIVLQLYIHPNDTRRKYIYKKKRKGSKSYENGMSQEDKNMSRMNDEIAPDTAVIAATVTTDAVDDVDVMNNNNNITNPYTYHPNLYISPSKAHQYFFTKMRGWFKLLNNVVVDYDLCFIFFFFRFVFPFYILIGFFCHTHYKCTVLKGRKRERLYLSLNFASTNAPCCFYS